MNDDLASLSSEMVRQWERNLAQWWSALLDDPSAVRGMGERLAAQAELRGRWEEGVDRSMEAMHLPSRKDLVRLARIASMLEDRLVAIEDQVLEQGERLEGLNKEVLRARVDAAEALVTVDERLATIEAKLDALTALLSPDSRD